MQTKTMEYPQQQQQTANTTKNDLIKAIDELSPSTIAELDEFPVLLSKQCRILWSLEKGTEKTI